MTDYRQNPRKTNDSQIALARLARGMTQAQLAAAIGVSTSQIALWETGARNPKLNALQKIAAALDIKLDDLI